MDPTVLRVTYAYR